MVDCTTRAENARDLLLGIDGGGSTSRVRLQDVASGARVDITGGRANVATSGAAATIRTLEPAIEQGLATLGAAVTDIRAAVVGLAGAGRSPERGELEAWLAALLPHGSSRLVTDVALVHAAGIEGDRGLAVVSGTGSVAVVQVGRDEPVQVGGWGPSVGDPGSGHAIGLAALRAIAREADGLGRPTRLSEAIPRALGLSSTEDLRAVATSVAEIAAVAAITSAVADAGDEIAIAICARAGRDLAEQALAAARRAGWGDQAIPCALAGGVVLGSQRVRDAFVEAMHRHGLVPAPLVLIEAPVEGAIMLARRLAAARGATS